MVGVCLLFAIKVVQQWEKVALLRLGKYVGLRGPGLFLIVPVYETLSANVDQRFRVASVSAESTLTRDTVPVNVDAIVFWLAWNVEKTILEVEDFVAAINMSAQTAMRESIGRQHLAQMITEREADPPLKINNAIYGKNGKGMNATNTLRGMIQNNTPRRKGEQRESGRRPQRWRR